MTNSTDNFIQHNRNSLRSRQIGNNRESFQTNQNESARASHGLVQREFNIRTSVRNTFKNMSKL